MTRHTRDPWCTRWMLASVALALVGLVLVLLGLGPVHSLALVAGGALWVIVGTGVALAEMNHGHRGKEQV